MGVVLVASCTGCGSTKSSHRRAPTVPSYAARVNAIQQDFARSLEPLSATITPAAPVARDEAALRRFGVALQTLVARLRAVTPPPSLAALHARLVAELNRYARLVRQAAGRASAGTTSGLGAAVQELVQATRASAASIDATMVSMNARMHG